MGCDKPSCLNEEIQKSINTISQRFIIDGNDNIIESDDNTSDTEAESDEDKLV